MFRQLNTYKIWDTVGVLEKYTWNINNFYQIWWKLEIHNSMITKWIKYKDKQIKVYHNQIV